jgi:hypothetical protein
VLGVDSGAGTLAGFRAVAFQIAARAAPLSPGFGGVTGACVGPPDGAGVERAAIPPDSIAKDVEADSRRTVDASFTIRVAIGPPYPRRALKIVAGVRLTALTAPRTFVSMGQREKSRF